jgi:hypothetical protein
MPQSMTALFGGTGPDWQAREVPVPSRTPGRCSSALTPSRSTMRTSRCWSALMTRPRAAARSSAAQRSRSRCGDRHHEVIATTTHDLAETALKATSEQGADVVPDHVGGQTLAGCLGPAFGARGPDAIRGACSEHAPLQVLRSAPGRI